MPKSPQLSELPNEGDIGVLRRALAGLSDGPVDLEDNGTSLRLLSILWPMLSERCCLDAGERLRQRPMTAVEDFLARYGASASTDWPRVFDGSSADWPVDLEIDASMTTQPASGVLLGAAVRFARQGARHRVRVLDPAAKGYLRITLEVLESFGFVLLEEWLEGDLLVEIVDWVEPSPAGTLEVPPDASSYSFYAVWRAMHDLPEAWPARRDAHPDWRIAEDLTRFHEAAPGSMLRFDGLAERPDTFPCLVALAALRTGRTEFDGLPALRHKESDRIHAMAEALIAMGVTCEERPAGLMVDGPIETSSETLRPPTPKDHRIVMALALLGTKLRGGVSLANRESVAKSWPGFFDWLSRVADVSEED